MEKRSQIYACYWKTNVFLIIVGALFLLPDGVEAQKKRKQLTCDRAYWTARDQYYSGRYESVAETLNICLADFESNPQFFRKNDSEQVLKVYKLIINSYYNLDYDNQAEEERQKLIDFFYGTFDKDEVLERMQRTRF